MAPGQRSGTMNPRGTGVHAIASWAAAALCRFGWPLKHSKAPEDWRSPKPGGFLSGSWVVDIGSAGILPASPYSIEKADKMPAFLVQNPCAKLRFRK
jgi:hypothetical protein